MISTVTVSDTTRAALARIDDWTLNVLPRWNRAVLSGTSGPAEMAIALQEGPLSWAPAVEDLDATGAQQIIVHLGFYGGSIGRQFQERFHHLIHTPHIPLSELCVTARRLNFLAYFEEVAQKTASGHPSRDAYASLVRWNVPEVEALWEDRPVAALGSVFANGKTRTYTGDKGEEFFLILLKMAEVCELVANDLILPIVSGRVPMASADAQEAAMRATVWLDAVHQINLEFAAKDTDNQPIFTSDHFQDIFRQFAVHWRVGDVPPSGAQDPEFLKRDFYLGINLPDYPRHVRRNYPALLESERRELDEAASVVPLAQQIVARLGLSRAALAEMSESELTGLMRRSPWVFPYYLLYRANARVASSHLGLTKRFLFNARRKRERAGIPDSPLVSNLSGTTGMLEGLLERLSLGRTDHALSCFNGIPLEVLSAVSGIARPVARSKRALLAMTRMKAPDRA